MQLVLLATIAPLVVVLRYGRWVAEPGGSVMLSSLFSVCVFNRRRLAPAARQRLFAHPGRFSQANMLENLIVDRLHS